ncbi:hypothetical protein CEK26_000212 [Fusarium fujikuroi]|uniref:Uncharacterized protein n=1 Tax=Fusarium fujikuroi TaxID=5127 RepID=A0A5Q3FCA3_FUSFU|nr:hypothetical protein CEK27_000209 [Fusarium fujikuroi]QGI75302.1 hypothetical protein CEK25_000208 [Fusarium fujikuroi]QGI88997.1 hypothetical protein CEK26_000212 [Fusarium fujikuroi]VTT62434.1 unnamed protein product [Fusarium fujikuroi]VTT75020.1 unnamed protein product [Fusarium fujikuroi]
MPEFKAVLSRIKALRLDIAQHKGWAMRYFTDTTAVPNQCQEAFTQLSFTWLSSTIAANLQVLSLHYESYWGWFPNIDIRRIGGGNGMPKLGSLALGRFVFSYQREVDWITSLDLEELFLEGCAILAKHVGHPTTQQDLWTDGHELPATTKIGGEEERTNLWWHEIIWQIRTSMPNLKRVCIVGKPGLCYHYQQFHPSKSLHDSELSPDEELSHEPSLWQQFIGLSKRTSCLAKRRFSTLHVPHYVGYDYVSHNPTYTEQASYSRVPCNSETDGDLARAEVIIHHSMMSKKSKKQHMGAEKLRLAPKMGSHDTNEYIKVVLRPLLASHELCYLKIILQLSDI